MAATLISDIASWCTTMLKRNDLTTEAELLAGEVYLLITQKVPFEELQLTSDEFNLTAGVNSYNLDFTGGVPSATGPVAGIVSIRYKTPTGRTWRLKRSHVRLYDALGVTVSGDPRLYARWEKYIELHPVPNSSSSKLRVRYWVQPVLDATVGNTPILTPKAWDALIKWETLYRLYYITGQEDKAGQLVMPMPMPRQPSPKRTSMFEVGIIPRLWNDLLTTYNMREAVDEDFNINPIRRDYTNA